MAMADPKGTDVNREQEEEKKEKKSPKTTPNREHTKKHWGHIPGSKKKPIRSFKSPGRK
jgi:3-mercaptopyruvate sulfurtransferase SseA